MHHNTFFRDHLFLKPIDAYQSSCAIELCFVFVKFNIFQLFFLMSTVIYTLCGDWKIEHSI